MTKGPKPLTPGDVDEYVLERQLRTDIYRASSLRDAIKTRDWFATVGAERTLYYIGGVRGRNPSIERSDLVLVMAGAPVRCMRVGGVVLKRDLLTEVRYITRGFDGDPPREPELGWAGSGGYWRTTSYNNVLLIARFGHWEKEGRKYKVLSQYEYH